MQLTSELPKSVAAEITAEHIRLIYRQGPVLSLGAVAGASIVSLMGATTGADSALHFLWWFAVVVSACARLLLFRSYAKGSDSEAERVELSPVWGMRFAAVTLLAGLVWGSWPLWFYAVTSTEYLLVVSVMIAAMVAVLANSASVYLPAFYCFAIPVSVPCIIFHLTSGQGALVWTGWLLFVFIVVNWVLASRGYRQYRDLFETRFRNNQLLEQLAGEKQVAELAVTEKNRFIAAASHDLRQPLHAINLLLAALCRANPNIRQQAILDDIQKSSQMLNQHFNAILDISSLESGAIGVNVTRVCLNELLQDLVTEFTTAAASKNLLLSIQATLHPIDVFSDRLLLERILRNLLSNAVKFTETGSITLSVFVDAQGNLQVDILDTGEGIDASNLERVFDEYHRSSSDTPGLGLGLSIVQRLCRLLDIAVSVASEPDHGTCFTLVFAEERCDFSATATAVATTDTSWQSSDIEAGLCEPGSVQYKCSKYAGRCGSDLLLADYCVLVIDDNTEILRATDGLLQQFGAQVATATDVQSAVALFASSPELPVPNVLLCDYRLQGGVTAFDAIAAVGEFFGTKLPACIITADTSPHRLLGIRASGYPLLHKPIEADELIGRLIEARTHPVA